MGEYSIAKGLRIMGCGIFKKIISKPESGSMNMLVVLMLSVILGSSLMYSTKNLRSRQSSVNTGSVAQIIATGAFAQFHNALANRGGCMQLRNDLGRFRVFARPMSQLTYSGGVQNLPSCIFEGLGKETASVQSVNIRVEEVKVETSQLYRDVKISVDVKAKHLSEGSRTQSVSMAQTYRVSLFSLDRFALVLRGTSYPLVKTEGPDIQIHGLSYYAHTAPISPEQIAETGGSRVNFSAAHYYRPSYLKAPANTQNLSPLKATFSEGIVSNVNNAFIDNFLPNRTPAWRFGIDFAYVEQGVGFPVPEHPFLRSTGSAAPSCDPSKAYQSVRGSANVIPSSQNFEKVTTTCSGNFLKSIYQFMDSTRDLQVNFSVGDDHLCAFVVANQLIVNLPAAGDYALFGHYVVNQLIVRGPPGADLHIHHPMGGENVSVTLDQGRGSIALNFKELSLSTAYNFYLPVGNPGSTIVPRGTDGFLTSCSQGGFAGYRSNLVNDIAQNNGILNAQIDGFYVVSRTQ